MTIKKIDQMINMNRIIPQMSKIKINYHKLTNQKDHYNTVKLSMKFLKYIQ